MTISIADYERTLEAFQAHLAEDADMFRSVMLYGSMARGEVVPGESDLDFWVFVKDEWFANEEKFGQLLERLTSAARILAESGLPVIHAFCYYGTDELGWLPRALVPNLASGESGRTIVGEPIFSELSSTQASDALYQLSYFEEMRRQLFQPLTFFLGRERFSEKEAAMIMGALKYVKYLPEAACAALNIWPGEQLAPGRLAQEMPELDISIVAEVLDQRITGSAKNDGALLSQLLNRSLSFVEAIHWQLVERRLSTGG